MSTVVGSVAFDTIHTPKGHRERALGGSAVYYSLAARQFAQTNIVGCVGADFESKHWKLLNQKNIDTTGIETLEGQTFFWSGEYVPHRDEPNSLHTACNVFTNFKPHVPEAYQNDHTVFLASIQPSLQLDVLSQMKRPKRVATDTRQIWIDETKPELLDVLRKTDILFINDNEARVLTGESTLYHKIAKLEKLGPSIIILKRGEYGATLFYKQKYFSIPAYLSKKVVDPTGAGDSLAGGFMGYLEKTKTLSFTALKHALLHGTAIASFTIESFGVDGLTGLKPAQITKRVNELKKLISFE